MHRVSTKLLPFLLFFCLLLLTWSIGVTLTETARKRFFRREAQRFKHLLSQDQAILDVGCGKGYFADALSYLIQAHVVCSDIQDRHQGRAPFVLAHGNTLPFPDKSFDTVTMFYVLHHTDQPKVLLIEARRVSRSKILIQEDTYKNLFEKIMQILHIYSFRCFVNLSGVSIRTDAQWQSLFAEVGLTVKQKLPVHKLGYPVTRHEYLLEVM